MTGCACCDNNDNCNLKCLLCNKVEYCDNQCREKDWTKHQKECNVYVVPDNKTWIALPYMYEDFATEKDLKSCNKAAVDELYVQTYLLKSYNSNKTVTTRQQIGSTYKAHRTGPTGKELGSGSPPDIVKIGNMYTIQLRSFDEEYFAWYTRNTREYMIYKDNEWNTTANALAKSRRENKGKYVFWPGELYKQKPEDAKSEKDQPDFKLDSMGGGFKITIMTFNKGTQDNLSEKSMFVMYDALEEAQIRFFKNARRRFRGLLAEKTKNPLLILN